MNINKKNIINKQRQMKAFKHVWATRTFRPLQPDRLHFNIRYVSNVFKDTEMFKIGTVEPVNNDHLYDAIDCLLFI